MSRASRERGGSPLTGEARRGWEPGSGLAAELRLLLLCARIELEPAQREELDRLAASRLDWEQVLGRAARHGISPLLARHLESAAAAGSLPASAWRALEAAWQGARLLGLRQRAEAGRLLDAFARAEVEAVALKGLALRETVYPDPGLRPSGDLDLLVRPAAIGRAEAALRSLGYVTRDGQQPGRPFHLAPYHRPGRELQVELHWDLLPPGSGATVDIVGLWERSVAHPVAGQPARLLAPEDLLLHLALHAAELNRMQVGLRHLVDVAEAVRCYGTRLDGAALAARAREWRAERGVYLALRAADDLLGVPGAGSFLQALRPPAFDPALAGAACQRVLSVGPPRAEGQLVQSAAHFFRAPSAREKLLFVWRNVVLPRHVLADMYGLPPGSGRVWLYYPLRPLQMAWRYAGLAWGAARGQARAAKAATSLRDQRALDRWLGQEDVG